mmetsp:Transcript_9990/g.13078  ORF Transcript_9990/g.13078 Transcript_9990/m.13078 type:complete len:81 (+) Transcript_9990:766-1008(+)
MFERKKPSAHAFCVEWNFGLNCFRSPRLFMFYFLIRVAALVILIFGMKAKKSVGSSTATVELVPSLFSIMCCYFWSQCLL